MRISYTLHLLGILIIFLALAMIAPLFVSILYKDGSSWALPPASDYTVGNKVVYPPEVLEQFKDKWQGTLNSNTITIEVVEKK